MAPASTSPDEVKGVTRGWKTPENLMMW